MLIMIMMWISILFNTFLPIEGAGLSSTFPRQTIKDPPNDWKYYPLYSNSNCSKIPRLIPDMEGVSYFSDGNFLNATIWLSGPFQEIPVPFVRFPIYAMWFGIIQPYDIKEKVDYTHLIQWNPLSSNWTRLIQEVLENDTRIIMQDNNYTNFFDNTRGKGHVNLSLDLTNVTAPAEYFVIFALFDSLIYRGNACGLLDITDTSFYIPPPKFPISVFPTPLEIRHGEAKTAELRLNSNSLVKSSVHVTTHQIPKGMDISIEPNETPIAPAGITRLRMNVKTTDDVRPGPYTIQLDSSISFPATIDVGSLITSEFAKINRTDSNNGKSNISPSGLVDSNITTRIINSRPSYFTVIVKSYPFSEQFKDFWSTYGDFISLVGGGFTAGAAALAIDRLRNRRKKPSTTFDTGW
jgi:hypothetical protein